jgi:hypothetical protein
MSIAPNMEKLEEYTPISSSDHTVPVLRAFLDHLPPDGKANIVHDLQGFATDENMRLHATSLVQGLLIPMKALRSSPILSPREGMEDSIENIASEFIDPAVRERCLKRDCLARDGKKCVVTGYLDQAFNDPNDSTTKLAYTECAHIIPFSLGTWKDDRDEQAKHIIWVNLNRCFPSIRNRINFTQDSINETRNAMTLSFDLHKFFGLFHFAFEATERQHTYSLKNYQPQLIHNLPSMVTFESHDSQHALPSPELLNVHAIIARILRASGLAEYIEKMVRDRGKTAILAKDGSSDIAALLAATSLSVLDSRAQTPRNIQQARPESSDDKARTRDTSVDRSSGKTKENRER